METVVAGRMNGNAHPYVVVYRSVKYGGVLQRTMKYISTYSRFYLLQPIVSSVDKFRKLLYEILGFFLIISAAPFLLLSFLALYIVRRIRTYLVRRFYPTAVICEDLQPRCILLGRSLGMVTSVVWTRGKINVEQLRSHFENSMSNLPSEISSCMLKKRLNDKFGVRVWMDSPVPFDIQNHIIGAPSKFYNLPITDEKGSYSNYGNKSVLQKYVTSCASDKLDFQSSPWRIYVIPQPVMKKQRTCCVLRFHYILLNDPGVRKILDELFSQKLISQESVWKCLSEKSVKRSKVRDNSSVVAANIDIEQRLEEFVDLQAKDVLEKEDSKERSSLLHDCPKNIIEEPLGRIITFNKNIHYRITAWVKKNLAVTRSDFRSWVALKTKQYNFHTKPDLLKVMCYEVAAKYERAIECLKKIPKSKIWKDLQDVISAALLISRAYCNIPIEIIGCLITTSNPRGNGFQRAEKTKTRQISWSAPISMDLVEAIQEKTDCSLESIVMTACALALKDYYLEMSLPNPSTINVAVPSLSCDLLSCTGFRSLALPTSAFNIPYHLRNIHTNLSEYPQWKLIGSYYAFKHISYFLPRSLAYVIVRKLMKRYPLTFNFVNIQSPLPVPLPHISLWGQTVDEFTFWRAPQSDFCVSVTLVKYAEIMRLSVLSPMKSVDTALTQKFSCHMNSIAEAVGVDRYRIPYSRKTSPTSSACSSPSFIKHTLLKNATL